MSANIKFRFCIHYNHVLIAKKLPQKLDKTKNKPIAQTITFILNVLS